jgi:hypothetical protein
MTDMRPKNHLRTLEIAALALSEILGKDETGPDGRMQGEVDRAPGGVLDRGVANRWDS